jgi:DNA-binding LacI/PurR family transcriptional regulator
VLDVTSENLSIRSIVLDDFNGGHEAANALIEQRPPLDRLHQQVNGIPAVFALQNVRS